MWSEIDNGASIWVSEKNYHIPIEFAGPLKGSGISTRFISAVLGQPNITKQPTNQSVSLGASATFQVVARSTNGPILYQWRLDGVDLAGRTGSALTLTNIQIVNAGDYDVILTNDVASITSQVAHLDVDPTFAFRIAFRFGLDAYLRFGGIRLDGV